MAPISKPADHSGNGKQPSDGKKNNGQRGVKRLPFSRTEKLTVASVALGVVALVVAVFAWLQPQHKADSDQLLDDRISRLIDAKQKPLADKIEAIGSKIDTISGKLEAIEPYVKSLVLKQMENASILPVEKLQAHVSQLADASAAGRSSGIFIDTPTLNKLRVNLSQISSQENQSYWTLSSNLLGMREVSIPSARACYGIPAQKVAFLDKGVYEVPFEDCSIDLADIAGFTEGNWYRRLWVMAEGKTPYITIRLTNVRVIYNGGPILPVNRIVFTNCLFDFHLNADPKSMQGRSIVKLLLASDDLQHTNVEVVAGSPQGE